MTFLSAGYLWFLLLPLLYMIKNGPFRMWSHFKSEALLLSAMILLIIGMGRPALSQEPLDVQERGSDIIIAVDLSYSMHATDIEPTRLIAAKEMLKQLIEEDDTNRYGIIAYTTSAIVLSPLSSDQELLLHLFDRLDETSIMTKGTLLMPTLKLARKMSKSKWPIVILLTDGGDNLNYNEEALFVKKNDLVVDVVMLATKQGSTLMQSDGKLIKDEKNNIVVSAANNVIREVTKANGGDVVSTLSELQSLLSSQSTQEYSANTKLMQYNELFYYFIVLALLLLMLHFTTLSRHILKYMSLLLVLLGVNVQAGVLDGMYYSAAQENYQSGHYEAAAKSFEAVESKAGRFGAASSYYKMGAYEKALELYQKIRSDDKALKSLLYYNMGNCYVRLKEFEKARDMYRRSLTLAYSKEAIENLNFIKDADEQDQLLTGQQEGKKRAQDAQTEHTPESGEQKEGGSSNQNSEGEQSKGAGGKQMKGDEKISFSSGKARLSSKQYELINERSVDEQKPW